MDEKKLFKHIRQIKILLIVIIVFMFLYSLPNIIFYGTTLFDVFDMFDEEECYEPENLPLLNKYEQDKHLYQELFLGRKYDELFSVSEEKLKEDPQDQAALWAKAEALFRLGRLRESKEVFLGLKDLAPGWGQQIDLYLKQIDQKLLEYQDEK